MHTFSVFLSYLLRNKDEWDTLGEPDLYNETVYEKLWYMMKIQSSDVNGLIYWLQIKFVKCEAKTRAVGNWARRTLAGECALHLNEAKGCLKSSASRSKAFEDTTGKPLIQLRLCQAAICILCWQKGNAVLIRFYLPLWAFQQKPPRNTIRSAALQDYLYNRVLELGEGKCK